MCDQETPQDESICKSMHHLSTTTAAAPESHTPVHTTKRHSSSSPSQFQEPNPKRATLHSPFSPPSAVDYHLLGYTKLQLPHPFPAVSPPLRRTLSEPIYSSPGTNKSNVTPPRPPAGRNSMSHRSKRMQRIRERMRELWNQVASEEGDDDEIDEHWNCWCNDKEENGNDGENGCLSSSTQEAVWIEKNGESLVLHFRCPCGSGYEVLLSGTSCYYKLTNF